MFTQSCSDDFRGSRKGTLPSQAAYRAILTVGFIVVTSFFTVGRQALGTEFPLSRQARESRKVLTKAELRKALPCDPGLVSRQVMERGFDKQVRVHYAGYDLTRTDVGDPEGWLTIAKNQQELCKIQLSLAPDIYLSVKNSLIILSGYNGSNVNLELFDLGGGCHYLGYLDYTLKSGPDPEVLKLLDSHDGSRECRP